MIHLWRHSLLSLYNGIGPLCGSVTLMSTISFPAIFLRSQHLKISHIVHLPLENFLMLISVPLGPFNMMSPFKREGLAPVSFGYLVLSSQRLFCFFPEALRKGLGNARGVLVPCHTEGPQTSQCAHDTLYPQVTQFGPCTYGTSLAPAPCQVRLGQLRL